jgi:hypothetical protein
MARCGKAGKAGLGKVWLEPDWSGKAGVAWRGWVGNVEDRNGEAG